LCAPAGAALAVELPVGQAQCRFSTRACFHPPSHPGIIFLRNAEGHAFELQFIISMVILPLMTDAKISRGVIKGGASGLHVKQSKPHLASSLAIRCEFACVTCCLLVDRANVLLASDIGY
jgi:hypothetical protein